MSEEKHDVTLPGCSVVPLAKYLKALGVLRLVAEQADPAARGWWQHRSFCLRSALDVEDVVKFFLHHYRPTPLVAPWNGGSGFYDNDRRDAIDALAASSAPRLAAYADIIARCRQLVHELGLSQAPSRTPDKKTQLLTICRGTLPDYMETVEKVFYDYQQTVPSQKRSSET